MNTFKLGQSVRVELAGRIVGELPDGSAYLVEHLRNGTKVREWIVADLLKESAG